MSQFTVSRLLDTGTLSVRDVACRGECRHRSAEECSAATHLVFPYRGVYVRHVGSEQSVADANHVLFFNADEGFQVSHPVAGGDSSLVLVLPEALLQELAPADLLARGGRPACVCSICASTRGPRPWSLCCGMAWCRAVWRRWKPKACC